MECVLPAGVGLVGTGQDTQIVKSIITYVSEEVFVEADVGFQTERWGMQSV